MRTGVLVSKVAPRSDYPIKVRPRAWEEERRVANLYVGIVDVNLNYYVDVTFAAVPFPWNFSLLPPNLDEVRDSTQACLAAVALANYVVSPAGPQGRPGEVQEFSHWGLDGD